MSARALIGESIPKPTLAVKRAKEERSVMKQTLVVLLALGAVLGLAATAAAQGPPREYLCNVVFGTGQLETGKWIDGEPFALGGDFQVAIDTAANFALYIDTDPERLTWYEGHFSLLAFPGSDAPLPGELSWAPCSSSWGLYRPGSLVLLDSFCESTTVPEPDEPGDIYEIFVREEVAGIHFRGTRFDCGRLHLNGLWDADTASAPEVTVSGKLCLCGQRVTGFEP